MIKNKEELLVLLKGVRRDMDFIIKEIEAKKGDDLSDDKTLNQFLESLAKLIEFNLEGRKTMSPGDDALKRLSGYMKQVASIRSIERISEQEKLLYEEKL